MNNRWSESIKNNILDLMPFDGSPVKAGIIYKKSKLSTVTVSKYLSFMVDEGIIERVQASQKNVSYRRLEKVRLQRMIANFTDEIEKSLSSFPKITQVSVDFAAEKISKYTSDITHRKVTEEEFEMLKNDSYFIEETLFFTLTSQMFKILKKIVPVEVARKEEFYVDSLGNVVPKKLVDQRINRTEIPEWNEHRAFNADGVRMIREGVFEKTKKKKD
jgi:hypothetical protein